MRYRTFVGFPRVTKKRHAAVRYYGCRPINPFKMTAVDLCLAIFLKLRPAVRRKFVLVCLQVCDNFGNVRNIRAAEFLSTLHACRAFLCPDMGPGDTLSFTGGVGVSIKDASFGGHRARNVVGGRAGLQFAW